MLLIQPTPALLSEPRPLANWKTTTTAVLLVAVMSIVFLPTGSARADESDSSGGSDEMGLKVGAWAVTVPYIIGKGAFAAGGAVVGALGYVFSGGSEKTAKAVWTKSIFGTYIIRPAHLRGEEAVHFLGEGHEAQNESVPASDHSPSPSVAPAPSVAPEKK